jgi:hypothetical protein
VTKHVPFLAVALLLLCGCKDEHKRRLAAEPVYSKQYRAATSIAIVTLSETNIPTSGKIQLVVDVHAPAGDEVEFPEIADLVAPFSVAEGYAEPVQYLPNGQQLHRRAWTLVPGLPGETLFQPLEIQAGKENIETDPIKIAVTSRLPADVDAYEIKDIAKPVLLLPEDTKRQRLKYFLLAFSGCTALIALAAHWRRRPKRIEVVPPDTAAFRALENLPEDALSRIDETRRILLEYLDQQFNIPTAGKTTGEIIRVIPKYPLLGRRITLVDFLTTNDLIRFSGRIPEGYPEEAVDYVREFVKETTEALCD